MGHLLGWDPKRLQSLNQLRYMKQHCQQDQINLVILNLLRQDNCKKVHGQYDNKPLQVKLIQIQHQLNQKNPSF